MTNDQQLVLPISVFLVGYVVGPIFFGPLSETYGRKIIMLSSFIVFTLFTMACAVAPNWPAFLIFRLICGINASSAIAVVGGHYADVFGNPVTRGRAMAVFMVVCKNSESSILRMYSGSDLTQGNSVRSASLPSDIRLSLPHLMALDVLVRLYIRRPRLNYFNLPPGDLRTYNSQTPCPKNAKRELKLQFLRRH